jgi:IS1 family transposase
VDRQNKRSSKEKNECMEGVIQRKNRKNKQNWKRLNRAVKCIIQSEERTWEYFMVNLQEDYKWNKLL